MSEYRRRVIALYLREKQAREIAAELGHTIASVNSTLEDARSRGELPRMTAGEKRQRRRLGHLKAFQKLQKGF